MHAVQALKRDEYDSHTLVMQLATHNCVIPHCAVFGLDTVL